MSKAIKNCPFCGGEVKLDENDFYMFCCDKCGAGITFAKELEDGTATDCNKDESIEKWNTRNTIENIVEQLEQQAEQYHRRANEYALKGIDRQCEHMAGKACSYEHAIEIVNQGGDGTDYVCEWKDDAYGRWHTKCNVMADNSPLEYKYCPYCGKKIKVVE